MGIAKNKAEMERVELWIQDQIKKQGLKGKTMGELMSDATMDALKYGSGTVSAPAYSFASDPDVGFMKGEDMAIQLPATIEVFGHEVMDRNAKLPHCGYVTENGVKHPIYRHPNGYVCHCSLTGHNPSCDHVTQYQAYVQGKLNRPIFGTSPREVPEKIKVIVICGSEIDAMQFKKLNYNMADQTYKLRVRRKGVKKDTIFSVEEVAFRATNLPIEFSAFPKLMDVLWVGEYNRGASFDLIVEALESVWAD